MYSFNRFLNPAHTIESFINRYDHIDRGNELRESTYAQPRALNKGDQLSNGRILDQYPVTTATGVALTFTNEETRLVPQRIPLELASGQNGILANQLKIGHVLRTGCVVLDDPKPPRQNEEREGQYDTGILLTHGRFGGLIETPSDLEIALCGELDALNFNSKFGKFVLRRLQETTNRTKRILYEHINERTRNILEK